MRKASILVVLAGTLVAGVAGILLADSGGRSGGREARAATRARSAAPSERGDAVSALAAERGASVAPLDASVATREAATPSTHAPVASAAVVLSGVVTDEAGYPVPGATLEVELLGPATSDAPATWTALDQPCTSDASGGFVVRSARDVERVAVVPRHPTHSSGRRSEHPAGDEGVRLVLFPAGAVEGEVLVDPGLRARLFVAATSTLENGSTYRGGVRIAGGVARVSIDELPGGTYTVAVGLEHEPESALRFDELVVVPDGTTTLPPVDLRGRVSSFVVRVTTADGGPPANGFVRRRAGPDEEFGARFELVAGGEAVVATLLPCVDLRIEAPRHRAVELACVASDREVVLAPAPTIRLALTSTCPSPDATLKLGASVERVGARTASYGNLCAFDERRMAEAVVDEPGEYDVRVYAWRLDANGRTSLLSNRVERRIEVGELGGELFEVALSDETLASIADAR